jgi:hypothetical protein
MPDLRNLAKFRANPAASREEITAAQTAIGVALPEDYVEFLLRMDGGEGLVGDFFVRFLRAAELSAHNVGYEILKYAPWALLFGSNGAGEGIAFDRESSPWKVVLVPFVEMEKEAALPFGDCFTDFLEKLVSGFSPFEQK